MASGLALRQLASEKEQELQSLREQHTHLLEEQIKRVRHELEVERGRLQQLQNDFQYNLSLLADRDQELLHYDSAFGEVRRTVASLLAENSELKVRLDDVRGELERERESSQQMKAHYTRRIEEQQTQVDAYQQAKAQEVEQERRKLEGLQRDLQRRLLEVEGELASQREQLSAEFEEVMRRREGEYQARAREMSTALLSREAQLKQLSRELQLAQSAKNHSKEDADSRGKEVEVLERQLRERQWEKEDALNMKDTRIAELEGELAHAQESFRTLQADFERRHAELDRLVREKESSLQAAKEAYRCRERDLEGRLRDLQGEVEQRETEMRRREWSHTDTLQEKEREIERLQQEVCECRAQSEACLEEVVREGVGRDLRLQALTDDCDKMRAELQRRQQENEHLQRELSLAVEREHSLERARAQAELDWQQRVQRVEREQYSRHQDILQQLTSSRDQTLAQCRELQHTASQQEEVIRAVQRERDIAITTLGKHGLAEEFQAACKEGQAGSHVTDPRDHVIQALRGQNEELRGVIHQMRQEMEELTRGLEHQHEGEREGETGKAVTSGYVKYMENEVMQVKSENRQLRERIQELSVNRKPPTPPTSRDRRSPSPPPPSSTRRESQHRSHLIALSDTIASLQQEKRALELQALQLRSHLQQREGALRECQEQVYLLKAISVPQSKVQQKLLQATRTIISLVKEKEQIVEQMKMMQVHARTQGDGERGERRERATQTEGLRQQREAASSLASSQSHAQTERDSHGEIPRQEAVRRQSGQGSSVQGLHLRVLHHLDAVEQEQYDYTRQQLQQGSPPRAALAEHPVLHRATPFSQNSERRITQDTPTQLSSSGAAMKFKGRPRISSFGDQAVPDHLEVSLPSLRFTDSDQEERESLQKVLEMVDREALSSTLQSVVDSAPLTRPQRSSTPQPVKSDQSAALELRGSALSGKPRSLAAPQVKCNQVKHRSTAGRRRETQRTQRTKIRNYNIKED